MNMLARAALYFFFVKAKLQETEVLRSVATYIAL